MPDNSLLLDLTLTSGKSWPGFLEGTMPNVSANLPFTVFGVLFTVEDFLTEAAVY